MPPIDAHLRMRRRFQTRAAVLFVFLAFPVESTCQSSVAVDETGCRIKGRITDQIGRPVDGAVVIMKQPRRIFAADEGGFYCITELAPGSYHLVFRAEGFADTRSSPVLSGLDVSTIVNVTLTPRFQEKIVVTATRTERRLEDVPIRVEVVESAEIERTAARTLADAVEFTTGVYVENNCQNCNFSQVRLLGLDGAYSQILVDSQPTISSLAAVYGVEHIPAQLIERLEIVKGGGSALYGPGSVAGVINVIPRDPVVSGGALETRFSWMDGRPNHSVGGAVDWVSSDREASFTVYGQTDRVSPLDLTRDGFTEVARREFDAFGGRLNRILLGGKAELTFDLSLIGEDRRGGNKLNMAEFQADVAESIESHRTSSTLTWNHRTGDRFDYNISGSYVETDRDSYYGSAQDPNAYGRTKNPLSILATQFNHRLESHTFSWGLQYSADELWDAQSAYDRMTDETYTNIGVYFQDDWSPDSRWELVYGLRLDKHSELDAAVASPRMAAKYAPGKAFHYRALIATGFRAPQVFDEDLHITQVGGEGQVIRNAEGLKEESSISSMLGIEWFPALGGAFGRVEANAFYTRIEDLFNVEETDDPSTPTQQEFTRVNFGKGSVYGIELNFTYDFTRRVNVDLGFVQQRARFDKTEPDFGSRDFFRTPERYGFLSLLWKDPRFVEVFIGARYAGSMKVPHYISDLITGDEVEALLETSESFLILDANVSRTFRFERRPMNLKITVGAKNLTDRFQRDLDQGQFRDSGYVYGPRFPRSFYIGMKVDF